MVFDGRLSNHAVAVQTIDDRQVFTEPWQNVSVLGTTDTDYYGDLDEVRASSDEVRYVTRPSCKSSSRSFLSRRQANRVRNSLTSS